MFTQLVFFLVSVKCIKNTPGYFAERLYKAMKVRPPHSVENGNNLVFGSNLCYPTCSGGWDQRQNPDSDHGLPF